MPFQKGKNNPAKRPEVRRLLSEQKMGEKNPMFGKTPWWKGKKFPDRTEQNSGMWKGDDVSYSGLRK
jgi:hypothetical protein